MIEVVSWPPVLSQWVSARDPYYLELYGETSPLLDTAFKVKQEYGKKNKK